MRRLRREPLKISLPNRNRNIIRATQPQNPTVAYNGPTPEADSTIVGPAGLMVMTPKRRLRRSVFASLFKLIV